MLWTIWTRNWVRKVSKEEAEQGVYAGEEGQGRMGRVHKEGRGDGSGDEKS